jgi:hypothetical protein
MSDVPQTIVNENARLELLRCLAEYRDFRAACGAKIKQGTGGAELPEYVPLFVPEWTNDRADILLAATEAGKLGDILLAHYGGDPGGRMLEALQGPVVCITDQGYDWIRARDLVGEDVQEAANRARPAGGSR